MLTLAFNIVCFRQFRAHRGRAHVNSVPSMFGNSSAVLPVTDVLSAVAVPTMVMPPPASYQRHDPAGMTEVVRSVRAGRAPRPSLTGGYATTIQAPDPTAACTAAFAVITSVAFDSRDPFLAPSLGFKTRFPFWST